MYRSEYNIRPELARSNRIVNTCTLNYIALCVSFKITKDYTPDQVLVGTVHRALPGVNKMTDRKCFVR